MYTNNNRVISYENANNITINTISGNIIYFQIQINNCMDLGGYDILNSSLFISNQNKAQEFTISAPVNLYILINSQNGSHIMHKVEQAP